MDHALEGTLERLPDRLHIDHVGIVEKVHSNGTITTIEGNHGDRVARVKRSGSIVGYGYWA
jgi:surface antigen